MKKRMSNFELLRILAMFMIIGGHYFSHGGGLGTSLAARIVYYSNIFTTGNTGSAIFLLLTGWFLGETVFTMKKVFRMLGEVFFYSITCLIIAAAFKLDTLTIDNVLASIFPVSLSLHWFASNYIIIYLFTPFIKKMCVFMRNNLRYYNIFIAVSCFSFVVLGFITPYNWIVNDLVWVFFLVVFGDWLHFWIDNHSLSTRRIVIFLISVIAVNTGYQIIATNICNSMNLSNSAIGKGIVQHITSRYGIGTLLAAMFYVLLFSRISVSSKLINTIAGTTLGVYLFHDNRLLYPLTWFSIAQTNAWKESPYQAVHFFICVICIFAILAIVDLIRKATVEKVWMKIADKMADRVVLLSKKIL